MIHKITLEIETKDILKSEKIVNIFEKLFYKRYSIGGEDMLVQSITYQNITDEKENKDGRNDK